MNSQAASIDVKQSETLGRISGTLVGLQMPRYGKLKHGDLGPGEMGRGERDGKGYHGRRHPGFNLPVGDEGDLRHVRVRVLHAPLRDTADAM